MKFYRYDKKDWMWLAIGIIVSLLIWILWGFWFNPSCALAEVELVTFYAQVTPLYDIKLGWKPSVNPNVDTYRIYRSTGNDSVFSEVGFVYYPDTTFTDSLLPPGHYYWAATSRDAMGNESGFSNVVDTLLVEYPPDTTAPRIPVNMRFEFVD